MGEKSAWDAASQHPAYYPGLQLSYTIHIRGGFFDNVPFPFSTHYDYFPSTVSVNQPDCQILSICHFNFHLPLNQTLFHHRTSTPSKTFAMFFLLHNIASFPSHRLSFFLKIVQRGWLASRTVSKWAAPMMMSSTKRNEKERRIGLVSSYIILDTQRHCSKLPLVNSNFILFQNWCLRKRLSVKFEDKSRTKPK